MEEVKLLGQVMAKALVFADEVTNSWAVVGNSVGNYMASPECVNILDVTAFECGRDMYLDVTALVTAFIWWALPALTGIAYGLALTY